MAQAEASPLITLVINSWKTKTYQLQKYLFWQSIDSSGNWMPFWTRRLDKLHISRMSSQKEFFFFISHRLKIILLFPLCIINFLFIYPRSDRFNVWFVKVFVNILNDSFFAMFSQTFSVIWPFLQFLYVMSLTFLLTFLVCQLMLMYFMWAKCPEKNTQ